MKTKMLLFPAPLLASVLALVFATACGKESKEKDSGACGGELLSDYNSIVMACNYDDESKCSLNKDKFLAKYSEVNCTAESGSGLDRKEVQVTRSLVQSLQSQDALAREDAERAAQEEEARKNENESGFCGENVLIDYNNLSQSCDDSPASCSMFKETFLTKYPKINCTASVMDNFTPKNIIVDRDRVNALK